MLKTIFIFRIWIPNLDMVPEIEQLAPINLSCQVHTKKWNKLQYLKLILLYKIMKISKHLVFSHSNIWSDFWNICQEAIKIDWIYGIKVAILRDFMQCLFYFIIFYYFFDLFITKHNRKLYDINATKFYGLDIILLFVV